MASRRGRLLLALLLAGGFSLQASRALADDQPLVDATVTRVIDGSTLDAQVGGVRTPVGYLGIETPPANQPCGREALERNQALVAGGVLLQADPAYGQDERHRVLYYAYTSDGTSIEETLLAEGLARAVRTDASHGDALAQVEADARAGGRGCVWATSS